MTQAETCEKCADALLDLSEHQPVTFESTRHVIASCPACGNELQRLVRGFAFAYQLPSEDPTTRADAFILRLADHHFSSLVADSYARTRVSRLRIGRPSSASLAMAAAALLMIAIGVPVLSISPQSEQAPIAGPAHPSPALQRPSEGPAPEPMQSQREVMPHKETESPTKSRLARGSEGSRAHPATDSGERQEKPAQPGKAQDAPLPRLKAPPASVPALADGASSGESSGCKMRVTVFEKLVAQEGSFTPSPAELLEVGLCYGKLGNRKASRKWLTEASKHQETKARAMDALERLD